MKTYQLGMYEKAVPSSLKWEEKMIAAKEAGYDYIEISIDETEEKLSRLNWNTEERSHFLGLQKKMKMPVTSMCLSGHRKYPLGSLNEEIRKRSLDIMEKAILLANDLGIRMIQLAGYDVYYEKSSKESKQWFEINLRKSVEIASKYGILLGFETMETPFMNTVEKAMNYVDKIQSPYLHVYPDLGNLTNAALQYGMNVTDDLLLGKGHCLAMHLKETKPGIFREVPFGEGHVDFDKGIQTAYQMGVRRYVTEFWHIDDDSQWQHKLNQVCILFKSKLDEVERKC